MDPLVSIITPAYNCEAYLADTIKTIQNQTYSNWEHIIIDDSSYDRTKEIMISSANNDNRIKNIFLSQNTGIANARNRGIELAHGKYIAFLDSDDLWKPEKLSVQISYMEENNAKFTYSNYEIIDKNGKSIKHVMAKKKVNYQQLLQCNAIGCLTVVIDSSILKKNLMPKIKHEDYATWLNILQTSVDYAENVGYILASYRKLSTSVSSNKLKTLHWTWNIYRNNQKLSLQKSIKQMCIFAFFTLIKYMKK
jgi:glycosyltransferase involved in cell wall biosynthesis